jgi:outer membrane protein
MESIMSHRRNQPMRPLRIVLWTAMIGLFCLTAAMCEDSSQAAPLSLKACLAIALKDQIDVLNGRSNVDIAKARSQQALSAYFPQVQIQNNTFKTGTKSVLQTINLGTALTATQNIYDGGLREAQVLSARYGVKGSKAGLDRTYQTVTFTVTSAYYEVLRAKHLADVADASVKYNEEFKKMVQSQIEVGTAAQVDVLPVDAQLANARVNLISAQNTVRTSSIQLQNEMGLSPKSGFDVEDVTASPSVDVGPVDTYVTTAFTNRPDVTQAQAGVGAAKASLRASRIVLYPRPVITGQYEKGIERVHGQSGQIVGGFTFDIFDGNSNRAAYKQAKASRDIAEQQSKQLIKDIEAGVQNAYLNLTNAQERLAASEVGLTAAQKNYEVQSAKYKQGLAITLDLLNAEVQAITAQTNVVQARYDYYIALAQLDYAVGKIGGTDAAKETK